MSSSYNDYYDHRNSDGSSSNSNAVREDSGPVGSPSTATFVPSPPGLASPGERSHTPNGRSDRWDGYHASQNYTLPQNPVAQTNPSRGALASPVIESPVSEPSRDDQRSPSDSDVANETRRMEDRYQNEMMYNNQDSPEKRQFMNQYGRLQHPELFNNAGLSTSNHGASSSSSWPTDFERQSARAVLDVPQRSSVHEYREEIQRSGAGPSMTNHGAVSSSEQPKAKPRRILPPLRSMTASRKNMPVMRPDSEDFEVGDTDNDEHGDHPNLWPIAPGTASPTYSYPRLPIFDQPDFYKYRPLRLPGPIFDNPNLRHPSAQQTIRERRGIDGHEYNSLPIALSSNSHSAMARSGITHNAPASVSGSWSDSPPAAPTAQSVPQHLPTSEPTYNSPGSNGSGSPSTSGHGPTSPYNLTSPTGEPILPPYRYAHRSNLFIRPSSDACRMQGRSNESYVNRPMRELGEEDRSWIEIARTLGLWKDYSVDGGEGYVQMPMPQEERYARQQEFDRRNQEEMRELERRHLENVRMRRTSAANAGASTSAAGWGAGGSGSSSSSTSQRQPDQIAQSRIASGTGNGNGTMPNARRRKLERVGDTSPSRAPPPAKRMRPAYDLENVPLKLEDDSHSDGVEIISFSLNPQASFATESKPSKPAPPPPETKPKVKSDPLGDYACPICFSPPSNATLTPCGHVCCGECLFTAVKAASTRAAAAGASLREPNVPRCVLCLVRACLAKCLLMQVSGMSCSIEGLGWPRRWRNRSQAANIHCGITGFSLSGWNTGYIIIYLMVHHLYYAYSSNSGLSVQNASPIRSSCRTRTTVFCRFGGSVTGAAGVTGVWTGVSSMEMKEVPRSRRGVE